MEQNLGPKEGSLQNIQLLFGDALRHHQAGRLSEAEWRYRQVLTVEPNNVDTLHLFGVLARQTGRPDVAVEFIRKAILLKNDVPSFYTNLGTALQDQGKLDEAVECYQRALDLKPDYPEASINLGNTRKSQKKYADAVEHYKRALVLKPGSAEAHNNLATVLRAQGNLGEALTHLECAVALKPDYAEAYSNLGNVLREWGRLDDAMAYHERALALNPNSTELLNNMGNIAVSRGRPDEAIDYFKRVLALRPDFAHAYSNLLLSMVYSPSVHPEELCEATKEFGQSIADPLRRHRPFVRNTDPERKLRVGYVSPDFHEHAVNYFFEHLLWHHNRDQFEIFAYSNNSSDDSITQRLRHEFDHWREIKPLTDEAAADLIEADAIDILVDLAGHTGNNRLMVFAHKPAPIQVTWLGYPATTGIAAMDYRITDVYAEPQGMTEHLNIETLWRLPEIFCCYQAPKNGPAVIDHPPFEDNGYITFGCFNNFAKVTDPVLTTWANIMADVPESRLLLEINGLEGPKLRASVEARLQETGLPLDRVVLEPRKRANQFVLYNKIDIALDPFPCAGGTTSMDTMWMGVPLITLAGRDFVSRMGVTILTNAGLQELIATSPDEYIRVATGLALDEDRLRGMRHNLRQKVAASPLMNQITFTRNIEAAYRAMWLRWCDSVRGS